MTAQAFYSLEQPLQRPPPERQMRAANFTGLGSIVRQLGGDPWRVIDHHGLQMQTLRDPDSHVECRTFVDVLEHCSRVLSDPLFGLRLAANQSPDVYGCVTALCRSAPTVRDALEGFVRYLPLTHSPSTSMELVVGTEIAELRWSVRAEVGTNLQAHLQGAMLDIVLLRQIAGRDFRPAYVSLTTDTRLKEASEIEKVLGCPFRARSSSNAVAIPTAVLGQRIPSASGMLYRLLTGYLDRLREQTSRPLLERTKEYIRDALASGTCSLERCATHLGISARRLQAQLNGHDLCFADLVDEERMALAKQYLREDTRSLDDIAALLGYSEQSSFGRAFRRWTGVTPRQYRAGTTRS